MLSKTIKEYLNIFSLWCFVFYSNFIKSTRNFFSLSLSFSVLNLLSIHEYDLFAITFLVSSFKNEWRLSEMNSKQKKMGTKKNRIEIDKFWRCLDAHSVDSVFTWVFILWFLLLENVAVNARLSKPNENELKSCSRLLCLFVLRVAFYCH